jgi:hypothetical protein
MMNEILKNVLFVLCVSCFLGHFCWFAVRLLRRTWHYLTPQWGRAASGSPGLCGRHAATGAASC